VDESSKEVFGGLTDKLLSHISKPKYPSRGMEGDRVAPLRTNRAWATW